MEANVFAGYEKLIRLDPVEEKTSTFTGSTTIDNKYNPPIYFKLTLSITSSLSSIVVETGAYSIEFSGTLSNGDTLVLDFINQEYLLNGNDIISDITFTNNKRPHLLEDSETLVSITPTTGYSAEINYHQYVQGDTFSFVENYQINSNNEFSRPRTDSNNIVDTEYNIRCQKMVLDWELYNYIETGKPLRIAYFEEHTNGNKYFERFLTDVFFDSYQRSASNSTDIIMETISGDGENLYKGEDIYE